jgi:hypothetical protein
VRVGDQHLPAVLSEVSCTNRAPFIDSTTPQTSRPNRRTRRTRPLQAVGDRRRRDVVDQLAVLGEQADIEPMAARHALSARLPEDAGRAPSTCSDHATVIARRVIAGGGRSERPARGRDAGYSESSTGRK